MRPRRRYPRTRGATAETQPQTSATVAAHCARRMAFLYRAAPASYKERMRFAFTHAIDAPLEAVERALLDPVFGDYLREHHAQMEEVATIETREEPGLVHRRVRYRTTALIEKIGPKRVPPEWMAWTEESTYDRARHELRFANVPTVKMVRNLLENRGTIRLVPDGDVRTRVVIEGELRVRVFLLGAIAERIIHAQAEKLLDEQARVMRAYVGRR